MPGEKDYTELVAAVSGLFRELTEAAKAAPDAPPAAPAGPSTVTLQTPAGTQLTTSDPALVAAVEGALVGGARGGVGARARAAWPGLQALWTAVLTALTVWAQWRVDPTPPPPAPTPTPAPAPGPAPAPDPTPKLLSRLRVLILTDMAKGLTRAQQATVFSPDLRAYLASHCAADGETPAWRFWDKDIDASHDTPGWRVALAAAKADPAPLPKVVVFDGEAVVKVAPVPDTAEAAIAFLRQYGGR